MITKIIGRHLSVTSLALIVFLLLLCRLAEAQQAKKIPVVGFLAATSVSVISARIEGFRQGLRESGYVEGKNIVVEYRYAEGKLDNLAALAAELVHSRVDIILTASSTPTGAAKQVATTIPIVMANDSDPVGNGFVASLARPDGNITGLTNLAPEISGKRLELLKEIIPKLSRVAVMGTSTNPGNARGLKDTELAAQAFGVKLQYLDVLNPKDFETAFRAADKWPADAVLLLGSPFFLSHRAQVAEFMVKSRLPAISNLTEFVETGGLLIYGVSVTDLFRRAATYVDKILKGAKPGDLPVERPTKFELVINLNAAKQIGLVIPPNVLARADRVIK